MDKVEQITPENVNLMDCDDEAIRIPGLIQPHGVLLVLEEPSLKILQASNNTEDFFDIPARDLINQNLKTLFSKRQIDYLKKCLCESENKLFKSLNLTKKVKGKLKSFQGQLHRHNQVTILELELLSDSLHIDFYDLVKQSLVKIKTASNFAETADLIVKEVRQITGYDRVMIFRFELDGSGEVIAEDKAEKLKDSYLHLHYPSIDIPQQAKKMYYENWLRLIVDMNYQPVEIIPGNHPLTGLPLDLTYSFLRSVSPFHVKYAQNMGFCASMTVSLIDDKKLWGLIVCHHYSAKYIDYKIRHYCEFLGQVMSAELVKRQEQDAGKYQEKIKLIQSEIKDSLLQEDKSIDLVLKDKAAKILELLKAQGAALYWEDNLTLFGETPTREDVQSLINWFLKFSRQEIFFTRFLSKVYPTAKQFKDQVSGLLVISIFLNNTSYHLFWFRQEIIHTVKWAGNPYDIHFSEDEYRLKLSPRRSFELWKETVRGKSLPWEQIDIDAALELRNTLLLAALEFSQSALQEVAERAKVASRAKSEFLAKMSHELRTPLNAILGFTQLMKRNANLSVQQREHINIISRSGEHLLALINDVLEMSKIELGKLTFNESNFDLYGLLESIKEIFKMRASTKGLELIFELAANVPQYVITDENKLRQVLFNLLENALKFTSTGCIILRVFCHQDPTKITFEVSDTGVGIAPEELDILFKPFLQTESGRKSMQGSGLGLPISRQFVQLLGGDFTVNSILNKGSVFSFNIKVGISDKSNVISTGKFRRVMGLAPDQPKYRILVVEDVEENRRLMDELLKDVGFKVQTAENGLKALEIWQTWQPDLILMDILMPIMDGYEATRRIKATTKGEKTVIIALTANAFLEEQLAVKKAGCDDFVSKPYQESILLEKIARHLGVLYLYDEDTTMVKKTAHLANLNPDHLKVMPSQWIHEINQAAYTLDDAKIMELISQIPENQPFLAEKLTNLVDDFRLDIIFDLTTAAHE